MLELLGGPWHLLLLARGLNENIGSQYQKNRKHADFRRSWFVSRMNPCGALQDARRQLSSSLHAGVTVAKGFKDVAWDSTALWFLWDVSLHSWALCSIFSVCVQVWSTAKSARICFDRCSSLDEDTVSFSIFFYGLSRLILRSCLRHELLSSAILLCSWDWLEALLLV